MPLSMYVKCTSRYFFFIIGRDRSFESNKEWGGRRKKKKRKETRGKNAL